MNHIIKLELPIDPAMLRETARMLDRMADSVSAPCLPGIHEDTHNYTTETRSNAITTPQPEVDTLPQPEPEPEVDTLPTPDVDSRGLPWDERIHAGTKVLNVDGTWRNKRGVDKNLLAQVEAELQGEHITEPEVATPIPTPTPTPATQEEEWTFGGLMGQITIREVDADKVLDAVQAVGLESIALLAARPDLVPQVARELGL
jgi:hypothetical protein